jgi:hypothetical protein
MDAEIGKNNGNRVVKRGIELFALEDGKEYRIPYGTIKEAVFSNIRKEELLDQQHAARLQYRLMLLEPVIKATVDFDRRSITVLYNPEGADNRLAKTDIKRLTELLAREGVHAARDGVKNGDYDYYGRFYSYAYAPPSITESAPYGYTIDEWKRMEPEFTRRSAKKSKEKTAKFRAWQEKYGVTATGTQS